MKKYIPILCVFVLSFFEANASEFEKESAVLRGWNFGAMYHFGKIIEHSNLIAPIIEHSTEGFEIYLSKQTYGKNSWNCFFNYPEYGLGYKFVNLGSPNYTGNAHCLFPYMNFHLLSNNSPLNINLRLGTGFAYVEKVYNADTNPLNLAFSTNLNLVLDAQLQLECKISSTWSYLASAGILHISNGAYMMPNISMNNVSFLTGISYSFGKENLLKASEKKINKKNRNWDCSVYLLGGIKEINPIGGKKYLAGDFNLEVTKRHLQYTRIGLSLDITHDTSEYDCIIFQSLPAVDRLKTTRIGISGGYECLFGDFSTDLFFGAYLYEPNPLYGKIYQRTSLRYRLSDRLRLSLTFRNHKGKADFLGLGFGIRL